MNRWHQRMRLGIIAVASFILLVTVLPQVASSIGLDSLGARLANSGSCSGSSGSSVSGSSSSCPPGKGTVGGTLTVTGAPKGFMPPYSGAGACPASDPALQLCAEPVYALASEGKYTLSLTAGSWRIDGFYELAAFGGAFLGTTRTVTVSAGTSITENLTVPYHRPAVFKGTVKVTGVPTGVPIQSVSVTLCPSYAPYVGVNQPIVCVNRYGSARLSANSGSVKVDSLPPGPWIAYPGYCSEFGCATNTKAGKSVTFVSGKTTTVALTTPFLTPDQGLLTGTVTVTGAPSGFSDPVGVIACQVGNSNDCQDQPVVNGSTYSLLLSSGEWDVTGLYLAAPFYNAIVGPTMVVAVPGGKITKIDLSVPYQVLGTATGSIIVSGVPPGVRIQNYTVLACPASTPWTGGEPSLQCVSEYSGPGGYGFGPADAKRLSKVLHPASAVISRVRVAPYNNYEVSTLTSGSWILYPGYETVFTTFVNPSGTTVNVVSGKTIRTRLDIDYQPPSVGAIVGTVNVVGAPADDFESGVQACTAPPTQSSCQDQQDVYNEASGHYELPLSPGTWWVSGFVYVFGPTSETESMTKARQVTVSAGQRIRENFTVTVSSS